VKKLLITLTLAAGLCGAFVWLPDACGQNGAPSERTARVAAPLRIACVDIREVLQQYKKTEDMNQEVRKAMLAGNTRIEQMVGQGRELEKPLRDGTIEKETPEFDERERKVLQIATNVSTFKAVKERELKQQEIKALLAVYQDISEAVRQFAEQNGYTLVLRIDREAQAAQSYKTIQQTMNQGVIRNDSRDDITDAVIAYLNKQYVAAGGADADPAPANPPATSDKSSTDKPPADKSSAARNPDRPLPPSSGRKASPR